MISLRMFYRTVPVSRTMELRRLSIPFAYATVDLFRRRFLTHLADVFSKSYVDTPAIRDLRTPEAV